MVECQEILEACLPLSTLSVTPAYSPVSGVGREDAKTSLWRNVFTGVSRQRSEVGGERERLPRKQLVEKAGWLGLELSGADGK